MTELPTPFSHLPVSSLVLLLLAWKAYLAQWLFDFSFSVILEVHGGWVVEVPAMGPPHGRRPDRSGAVPSPFPFVDEAPFGALLSALLIAPPRNCGHGPFDHFGELLWRQAASAPIFISNFFDHPLGDLQAAGVPA